MAGGIARGAAAFVAAGLAWGLVEAQWVERRRVELPLDRLPERLDGLSILHLSDLHLGSRSLNGRALRKAVDWAAAREVDLVAITGDLLAHERGEAVLVAALARLRTRHGVVAILGNHDVLATRDPFSRSRPVAGLGRPDSTILSDEAVTLELRGRRVQVAGFHARRDETGRQVVADPDADLRILLAHFPEEVHRPEAQGFDLVLAGHTHGGQICVPTPLGKARLAALDMPYPEGVHRFGPTTLVVSRGVGTTFVPFRFLARPEVVELVLRTASGAGAPPPYS